MTTPATPLVEGSDAEASIIGQRQLQNAVTARSRQSATTQSSPASNAFLLRQPTTTSESEHLNRNRFNVLPKGKLTPIGDASASFEHKDGRSNSYGDEAGLVWELLPDSLNTFHQPEGATMPYPNKKLLHRDASGGSSEAIRQPDGSYLTTGPKQGTYNYVHPEGLGGTVGHGAVDLVPHLFSNELFSDEYVPHPPLDASKPDVDTYRLRWEQEVGSIGHVPDYSGTTGGTFFGMIQIKDGAGTRPAVAYWHTTFGPWGHWRFVRWISPEMEKMAEAKQKSQTGNRAIETVERTEVKNVK